MHWPTHLLMIKAIRPSKNAAVPSYAKAKPFLYEQAAIDDVITHDGMAL